MWVKHKQSEIQMVKRNSTSTSSNHGLYWWGEKYDFWNTKFGVTYCLCTMTAIQMIKRIHRSSKFKQLPSKIENELPSWKKTDSEFILISAMRPKHKQSEIHVVKRNSKSASSNNCLNWWREKLPSWNDNFIKEISMHHGSNPNNKENSHTLKIQTASSNK